MKPITAWGVLISLGPIPSHLPCLMRHGVRGAVYNSDDPYKAKAKAATLPKAWDARPVRITITVEDRQ